jgi:hypothetical protein
MALAFGFAAPARANISVVATIGEYSGAPDFDFNPSDYPLAPVLIGDFTFAIPAGGNVIGGTISGTFGNNSVPGLTDATAPSDYYINGGKIEVASCDDSLSFNVACDTATTPTAWSYTLSPGDLSNLSAELSAGSIDFTVVQNFGIAVQTGNTTLNLVVTPEPSGISLFLFGGVLAGVAVLRRYRRA